MNFCNNLQKLRKKMNLSQEQLAESLNVTRQSVSKWESGASYPEMDKLLALCKIFNCGIDDLVNKNIDEVKDLTSSKKVILNFFKSVGDGINKTIRMLESFSFKELVKFLCQIAVIIIVIALCNIPFQIIENAITQAFYNNDIYEIISSFCSFIMILLYSCFAIIAFFYVYKVKFLDNIDIENSDNDNKTILYNENKNILKKENFTIKSGRLSILDLLMNLFIWFLKFIFIIFMFPIIMSIIGGVICFVLLIILIFKGLFLIGPIIISLSLVVFSIMIMEILFNFIVNKKTNFKRIFIVCISSIVLASIGIGLSIGYFSNIEIINKAPNQYEIETKEEIIPMNDKLFIHDNYYGNIDYIEDNNLNDQVKIDVDYYKSIYDINIISNENNTISIHSEEPGVIKIGEYLDQVIDNLKNKKIYNYDILSEVKIRVTTSSENINKIKYNRENYIEN